MMAIRTLGLVSSLSCLSQYFLSTPSTRADRLRCTRCLRRGFCVASFFRSGCAFGVCERVLGPRWKALGLQVAMADAVTTNAEADGGREHTVAMGIMGNREVCEGVQQMAEVADIAELIGKVDESKPYGHCCNSSRPRPCWSSSSSPSRSASRFPRSRRRAFSLWPPCLGCPPSTQATCLSCLPFVGTLLIYRGA